MSTHATADAIIVIINRTMTKVSANATTVNINIISMITDGSINLIINIAMLK